MHPDYPHKIFDDKRHHYSLLMEALAMDSVNESGTALIPRPFHT